MKRNLNSNKTTHKGRIPLRLMFCAVLLSALTSLNSFGQTAPDYQAQLTALLAKKDVYKVSLSQADYQTYQMQVAALQLKLHLPVTIPGAPGYVAPPTTEQQIASYENQIAAIYAQLNATGTLTKAQILQLYAQLGILNTNIAVLNGNAPLGSSAVQPGPFSNTDPAHDGVYSFDPNKVP